MTLDVTQIPVLSDNYVYLLRDRDSAKTAVVDPAVAGPVLKLLNERDWQLDYILNTHHHGDHVGGNRELKAATGCCIVGPAADRDRIPLIDQAVGDGDTFSLGDSRAKIFDVPGHTRGHIAYWFENDDALFCGDTLFSMGCGRLFEGTPAQMLTSLGKLRRLPDDTRVYCAHEYTETNGNFALTVEPANPDLQRRMEEVRELRARNAPTVPSTLGVERRTNPFLRPDSPEIRQSVGLVNASDVDVFAEVRRRKDSY